MTHGRIINVGDSVLYKDIWSKVDFVEIDDINRNQLLILRDGRNCSSTSIDSYLSYEESVRPLKRISPRFDIQKAINFSEWWEENMEVMENKNEIYTAIVGWTIGSHWVGWGLTETEAEGHPSQVSFDYKMIYDREDSHGDVIGFYHTHPSFTADPSSTDYATMKAWVVAFGRPMLCMIEGTDGLRAHWFVD